MVSRVTETPLSPFLGLVLRMGDGGIGAGEISVAVRGGPGSGAETGGGGSGAETGGVAGLAAGIGVGVGPPRVKTTPRTAASATIRTSRPGMKYRRKVFVFSDP